MIAEGIGLKRPAPKKFVADDGALRVLFVESQRRAEKRGYESKAATWQRGILGSMEISGVGRLTRAVRPIFAGMVGEYAVASACGGSIDLVLRDKGDEGIDLTIHGLDMQIKACQSERGANLVRVRSERGRRLPLKAEAFVFCRYEPARTAWIRGWVWRKDIESLPEVPSAFGRWMNLDISNLELLPISALKDELEARRIIRSGNH